MNYILPPMNLSGQFQLKPPLTPLVNEKVTYTVDSVKTITSYLTDGIDVKQLIYVEQGLTEDVYSKALKENMPIVELKTEGGSIVTIPADYIVSIPTIVGVTYTNKAMIINLGFVPKALNLDFLIPEIESTIDSLTGLESSASMETISGDFIETYELAETLESTRTLRITNNQTCQMLLAKSNDLIKTYKIKIKALVNKIEKLTS